MRIVVFGADGMLGQAVVEEARKYAQVQALSHKDFDIASRHISPSDNDVWINCAGILRNDQYGYEKQHAAFDFVRSNAIGPHHLAMLTRGQCPLIHVSTDCVFSGKGGLVSKSIVDPVDPNEVYGLTKAVGELIADQPNVTVVRTSFMGLRFGIPRMIKDAAFNKQPIRGYAQSYWSGSTVWAVARALVQLALNSGRPRGLQHLSTLWPISKAQAFQMIVEALELDLAISIQHTPEVRRGLVSTITLEPFQTAVKEMAQRALHTV